VSPGTGSHEEQAEAKAHPQTQDNHDLRPLVPRCQATRPAKARRGWRCAACIAAGLEGRLRDHAASTRGRKPHAPPPSHDRPGKPETPDRPDNPDPLPFCFPRDRIAFEDDTRALWDAFPVSPGHLLIVPRRHIPTWFDASDEERAAILAALDRARDLVADRHHPHGYNVGWNVGKAAGQTVFFHLHVHLIPRYEGDVRDPRGGVRHVIPGKGNYLAPLPGATATQESRLVEGGEDDPLMPYLGEELCRAQRADIVVGFVMPSGVSRIEGHLRDFLGKGGRRQQLNLSRVGPQTGIGVELPHRLVGRRQRSRATGPSACSHPA
jgi:diadenosine tetraphosphate (Ap4A) HIT family hydrolase